jgi:hypothetical protein
MEIPKDKLETGREKKLRSDRHPQLKILERIGRREGYSFSSYQVYLGRLAEPCFELWMARSH